MEQRQTYYLPKFYTMMRPPMESFVHPPLCVNPVMHRPEQIDELVAIEMQHLRSHYANEEQRYVDQMLEENPVVVERRAPHKFEDANNMTTLPTTTTAAKQQATATTEATATTVENGERNVLKQRAESCRKSRYNNKIKKAKLRFRHKFVSNQLAESEKVLEYIRDVIAQAESQLLSRGFKRTSLEHMRQSFGLDRPNTMTVAAAAAAAANHTLQR